MSAGFLKNALIFLALIVGAAGSYVVSNHLTASKAESKNLQGNLLAEIPLSETPAEVSSVKVAAKKSQAIPVEEFVQQKPVEAEPKKEVPPPAESSIPSEPSSPSTSPSPEPEPAPPAPPAALPAVAGEPSTVPTPAPIVVSNGTHVVISEVQVAGTDSGDEFIEFYNPTAATIDVSEWSVQYVSGTTNITDNAAKKNFEAGQKIPAHGFFLVARAKNSSGADGYTGVAAPDIAHRTISLSGTSNGGKIFVVRNQEKITDFADPDIVDWIDYAFLVPPANQSLERQAYSETQSNNFEIRLTPNPQNTSNISE